VGWKGKREIGAVLVGRCGGGETEGEARWGGGL
jgi:hypothetical protein